MSPHIEDFGIALLSSEETAERLGITKRALTSARKAGRLFALESAGQYYYPAFFSDRDFNRRTLERVSLELNELSSRVKLHWFTHPSLALSGQTPLQAISAGKVGPSLKLPAHFGRHRTPVLCDPEPFPAGIITQMISKPRI